MKGKVLRADEQWPDSAMKCQTKTVKKITKMNILEPLKAITYPVENSNHPNSVQKFGNEL